MNNFQLAKYNFDLEFQEPAWLPEFKGSMFRGGFGSTLKRICCAVREATCTGCALAENCPYSYIFETPLPPEAAHLKNPQIPRPYLFEPQANGRRRYEAGEILTMGVTVIGRGIKYLPYFIVTIKELGEIGVTAARRKFKLKSVTAVDDLNGQTSTIYEVSQGVVKNLTLLIAWDDCLLAADKLPANKVTLKLVTPMRLKYNGNFLTRELPLEALVQSLTLRINALNVFHCGGRLIDELKELRSVAAKTKISASNLSWQSVNRYSSRQGKKESLSGLVGNVTYEGDLKPLQPLLVLGSLIHVGSDVVFGCGEYEVCE